MTLYSKPEVVLKCSVGTFPGAFTLTVIFAVVIVAIPFLYSYSMPMSGTALTPKLKSIRAMKLNPIIAVFLFKIFHQHTIILEFLIDVYLIL